MDLGYKDYCSSNLVRCRKGLGWLLRLAWYWRCKYPGEGWIHFGSVDRNDRAESLLWECAKYEQERVKDLEKQRRQQRLDSRNIIVANIHHLISKSVVPRN